MKRGVVVLFFLGASYLRHIIRRKRSIAHRIGKVQVVLDCRCSGYLINIESKLRLEYENILDEEELPWKQKSRMDWVHFGDCNTKLFHNKALIRRNFDKISALKIRDN
ncbi:hypothetical protein ES332_D10G232100v1 [Gossypium tomentosum]|uniref:Uncharacterized protein n=1 Tax=Gossypium tomentosum TaxID=34277 RepID=A0A5D2J8Z1_GOSTO|nr:hypothetical protein ES332_D10G232100v1 [Gossypium tomentosum]